MPGSPIVLEPSADAHRAAFFGNIDQITDTEASGWITLRNEPSRHCVVALKEEGRVLARAVASGFRADLLAAGIGDGCYAFSLPMPRSLLDGDVHLLEIVEEGTGFSLTEEPIQWRSTAGTAEAALTSSGSGIRDTSADSVARRPAAKAEHPPVVPRADYDVIRPFAAPGKRPAGSRKPGSRAAARVGTRFLFDLSDLVYYLGHHPNLTGIQRVQSSIVLSMIDGGLLAPASVIFLSFNARTRNWDAIPTGFLISLLRDLFLPEEQRLITFSMDQASHGELPGAQPFDGTGVLDDGNPSVLCLLGAAWVQRDYVHRVLEWKRRFGTRFVMTVHDLIPIYARETCDQDTVRVFEEFMRRALRQVDHILAVSESTAKDVRRYLAQLQLPEPPITVTRNGSSFAEFLPKREQASQATLLDLPERFVLFVATIEGRKNHRLIFNVWQRMIGQGDDPPHLICVGRLGWKATAFVSALVETNYLDGRVHILREISDTDLWTLYERCLFTVCPTLYEGWGLPVGEALAMGKICVCSDRTSISEVAGDCGVYIDIDSVEQSLAVIRTCSRTNAPGWRSKRRSGTTLCRPPGGRSPNGWSRRARRRLRSNGRSRIPTARCPMPPKSALADWIKTRTDRAKSCSPGWSMREPATSSSVDWHRQSFLLGEEIRSGGAWAEPERWGTWLCHSGGDVAFSLAAEASEF